MPRTRTKPETRATARQRLHAAVEAAVGPLAPRRGWNTAAGGRAAHIDTGRVHQGTAVQVCGLYPFMAGSGSPSVGVPLGEHLLWRDTVAFEPHAWLDHGLVTNTGTFVLGQPGTGKSACVKRLITGSAYQGIRALVLGEPKGEYTPLVTALGGQVVRLGADDTANTADPAPGTMAVGGVGGRINPLDYTGLDRVRARAHATGHRRLAAEIAEEIRSRRVGMLRSLVLLTRASRQLGISEVEDLALSAALDLWTSNNGSGERQPTLADIAQVLQDAPPELRRALFAETDWAYEAAVTPLCRTLAMLRRGSLGRLFGGHTTVTLDPDAPVISIDISALAASGEDVVAAAMLATWSYGLSLASAARYAAELDQTPPVRWIAVMDELWRALRAAGGVVDLVDSMTRLGRAWGIAPVMISHSLDDLDALAEQDRAKARGLIERSAVTVLAALPERELHRVHDIIPLTSAERAMTAGWSAPSSVLTRGGIHPGRGKALLKFGGGVGLPVQLRLTPEEIRLYDTDHPHHLLDDRTIDVGHGGVGTGGER